MSEVKRLYFAIRKVFPMLKAAVCLKQARESIEIEAKLRREVASKFGGAA